MLKTSPLSFPALSCGGRWHPTDDSHTLGTSWTHLGNHSRGRKTMPNRETLPKSDTASKSKTITSKTKTIMPNSDATPNSTPQGKHGASTSSSSAPAAGQLTHAGVYLAAKTKSESDELQRAFALAEALLVSTNSFLRDTRRCIDPAAQRAVNEARAAAKTLAAKWLGVLLVHSARYKTTPCNKPIVRCGYCKFEVDPDRHGCLFSHGQTRDLRRDPLVYYYEPCMRPNGGCRPDCDASCPYAHNQTEITHHPVELLRQTAAYLATKPTLKNLLTKQAVLPKNGAESTPKEKLRGMPPPLMAFISLRLDLGPRLAPFLHAPCPKSHAVAFCWRSSPHLPSD